MFDQEQRKVICTPDNYAGRVYKNVPNGTRSTLSVPTQPNAIQCVSRQLRRKLETKKQRGYSYGTKEDIFIKIRG